MQDGDGAVVEGCERLIKEQDLRAVQVVLRQVAKDRHTERGRVSYGRGSVRT